MAQLRLVTNKGLQMLGEATGEDVIIFSRAYLSEETFTEEQIYAMTVASGDQSTDRVSANFVNDKYIVTVVFDNPSQTAKSIILCGRLQTQDEDVVIPITVYTSDYSLGLSGTESTVTFTLGFSSDGNVETDDSEQMSRGEMIAYINQLFRDTVNSGGDLVVTLDGQQLINGRKRFTSPVSVHELRAINDDSQGITFDGRQTRITSGNDACFGGQSRILMDAESIELDSDQVLIPFNGQKRSLQALLSGVQDANREATGSLRHAIYNLVDIQDGTAGTTNQTLHIVSQTEFCGDMSMDGTCFLRVGNYLYAVICIGTADVSECTQRARSFGNPTFRVNFLQRNENTDGTSLRKSVDAMFRWYDNKQALLGNLSTPDALPCFSQGSRCACLSLIPLGNVMPNSYAELEVSVSNSMGGSSDGADAEAIEEAIAPLRTDIDNNMLRMTRLHDRFVAVENEWPNTQERIQDNTNRITALERNSGSGSQGGISDTALNEVNARIDTNVSRLNDLQEMVLQLQQGMSPDASSGQGGNTDQQIIGNIQSSLRAVQNDLVDLKASYDETALWGTNTFAVLLCAKENDGNVSHNWVYTNSKRTISTEFTPRVDFENAQVSGAGIKLKLTYPFGILRVGSKNVQLKNMPLALCIEYELTKDDRVTECHSVFNLTATNSPTVILDSVLQPLIDIPWEIACIRFMEAHLPYTGRDSGSVGYTVDYEGFA
jgi:hypothetical protein